MWGDTRAYDEVPFDALPLCHQVACSGQLDAARGSRLSKYGLPRANKKLNLSMVEFFMRRVVETGGFEPPTPCMRSRCSPLSYAPTI